MKGLGKATVNGRHTAPCIMHNCELAVTDKVKIKGSRKNNGGVRVLYLCKEHADYIRECERTFAPIRKILVQKYADYDGFDQKKNFDLNPRRITRIDAGKNSTYILE